MIKNKNYYIIKKYGTYIIIPKSGVFTENIDLFLECILEKKYILSTCFIIIILNYSNKIYLSIVLSNGRVKYKENISILPKYIADITEKIIHTNKHSHSFIECENTIEFFITEFKHKYDIYRKLNSDICKIETDLHEYKLKIIEKIKSAGLSSHTDEYSGVLTLFDDFINLQKNTFTHRSEKTFTPSIEIKKSPLTSGETKSNNAVAQHPAAQGTMKSMWEPVGIAPKYVPLLLWDGRTQTVGEWCGYWKTHQNEYVFYPTHWLPLPQPPGNDMVK